MIIHGYGSTSMVLEKSTSWELMEMSCCNANQFGPVTNLWTSKNHDGRLPAMDTPWIIPTDGGGGTPSMGNIWSTNGHAPQPSVPEWNVSGNQAFQWSVYGHTDILETNMTGLQMDLFLPRYGDEFPKLLGKNYIHLSPPILSTFLQMDLTIMENQPWDPSGGTQYH